MNFKVFSRVVLLIIGLSHGLYAQGTQASAGSGGATQTASFATVTDPLPFAVVKLDADFATRISDGGHVITYDINYNQNGSTRLFGRWLAGVSQKAGAGVFLEDINSTGNAVGAKSSAPGGPPDAIFWPWNGGVQVLQRTTDVITYNGYIWAYRINDQNTIIGNQITRYFPTLIHYTNPTTGEVTIYGDSIAISEGVKWVGAEVGAVAIGTSELMSQSSAPNDPRLRYALVGNLKNARAINDAGTMLGFAEERQYIPYEGSGHPTATERRSYKFVGNSEVSFNPIDLNNLGRACGQDGLNAVWWGNGQKHILGQETSVAISDDNAILTGSVTSPPKLWRLNPDNVYIATEIALGLSSAWTQLTVADMNNSHCIVGTASKNSDPAEAVMLVPAELAVDANRDGVITLSHKNFDPQLSDITSEKKPFRFWSNDDDDGSPPDEDEHVNPSSPDYADRTITSRRDLEDFARLWINIGGLQDAVASGKILVGLKWKDTGGTSPSINIYKAVEPDGGTKYLTDTDTATAQVGSASNQCRSVPNKDGQSVSVVAGTTFIFGADFWTGFAQNSPPKYLLFEGCTPGKGQLSLVFLKPDGTEIGDGPGVWMDIKNIQSMYQRVKVTPRDPNGIPKPYQSSTTFDASTTSTESFDNGYPLQAAPDEAKSALVFVHGSNIAYEEARWNAETMFKRLYWQGYKGRFVLFYWDTLVGFDVPLPDPLNQVPALPYNLNEYRALKYGPALKSYVATLSQGRTVNVTSHSLGAGVVISALKAGMTVNNYVILQGAYSAKSFNANLPTLQKFQDAETEHATPDLADKLGYGGYLSGVNGTVINMLNPDDFALATGSISVPLYGGIELNWEANQLISKPDDPIGVGQYYYYPYSEGSVSYTLTGTIRLIYDAHESMAFVARTRTKAVGAMPGVGGFVSQDVILNSNIYGFGSTRPDHSAEFTRRVQEVQAFYRTMFEKVR